MSKAQRNRRQTSRERIAARQAAARRAETRRRVVIAGGGVLVVLALVVAIIVAKLGQAPAKTVSAATSPVLAHQVTSVSPAVFDAVGAGTASGLIATKSQPELTRDGKPEVLYMGGEYCPYCAAERWAIAAALSRFGTLSGLRFIHSSPADVYANTPTLSFYRARYASNYLAFVPVEWYGEAADAQTPFGHVYLQQPTPQEAALFDKYASNSIPFLDIADRYLLPGVSYPPSALSGLTWSQVATDMHSPGSTVGKDIDGAANIISAAICRATKGQPGSVCTSAGVTAAGLSL